MKQIGIALMSYESANGMMPGVNVGHYGAGPNGDCGQGWWSPQAAILPFMEQQEIYDMINYNVNAWHYSCASGAPSQINTTARKAKVRSYLCPSDPGAANYALAVTHYRYCYGAYHDDNRGYFSRGSQGWPGTQSAAVRDGTSHTVMFGEKLLSCDVTGDLLIVNAQIVNAGTGSYTDPVAIATACKSVAFNPTGPCVKGDGSSEWRRYNEGENSYLATRRRAGVSYNHAMTPNLPTCFMSNGRGALPPSSHHAGGVHCLFGDGTVHFVGNNVDEMIFRAISTTKGSEPKHDL